MNGRVLLGNQQGLTLVELVLAIVVISVALGGVLLVINHTLTHSADPMLRQQALAVAESYLEETTLKPYLDPDDGTLCPAPEASRALYDNVCDYAGLVDVGAHDQNDSTISGLENYRIAVAVETANFGSPAVSGLKIRVTVTDPAGEDLSLVGYRAPY